MSRALVAWLILALGWAGAGCEPDRNRDASPVPDVLHVDADASPEERAQVEAALAFTQAHVDRMGGVTIAWDGPHAYPVPAVVRITDGAGGQTHFEPRQKCAITCGAGFALARCIAHELGHCAGLDHVDDPAALMYWRASVEALAWTAADARECAAAGACAQ